MHRNNVYSVGHLGLGYFEFIFKTSQKKIILLTIPTEQGTCMGTSSFILKLECSFPSSPSSRSYCPKKKKKMAVRYTKVHYYGWKLRTCLGPNKWHQKRIRLQKRDVYKRQLWKAWRISQWAQIYTWGIVRLKVPNLPTKASKMRPWRWKQKSSVSHYLIMK